LKEKVVQKENLRNCRISVLIPCFNTAHYLGEAIQSVLAQTHPADEIIVIDDGSTDNTAQIAAAFAPRIQYIYQPNAGLSAARNTGIKIATGQYIGFLDADDLWHPDFLATLTDLLERHADWGAVYAGNLFIDARGKLLSQSVHKVIAAQRLHDALVDDIFFPPCAVLVRKTALDAVGLFDESLRACEDWDMWLRISAQYRFGSTSQTLALYRRHGSNMTGDLARMQENMLAVVRKHFGAEPSDSRDWSSEQQRAFGGVYFRLGLANYQRRQNETAQAWVKKAFLLCPSLASSLDVFYMLGCADQPAGYVGDVETLHLNENAENLFATLDSLFADVSISAALRAKRRASYAMAYFALGILAYRQRALRQTRAYLLRAFLCQPTLLMNSQWRSTFAKTFLGARLLDSLRAFKSATVRREIPPQNFSQ
jgi:glycosyltransferase involved in cell wall biosynthesis